MAIKDNPSYLAGVEKLPVRQVTTNQIVATRIDFRNHPLQPGDIIKIWDVPPYHFAFKALVTTHRVEGQQARVEWGVESDPDVYEGLQGDPDLNIPDDNFFKILVRWRHAGETVILTATDAIVNADATFKVIYYNLNIPNLPTV